MSKNSGLALAAAVALLAAPAFASTPVDLEPALCSADATAAVAEVVPEEPEAAPAEEADLEIEEAMNPEPMPAWCPTNRRCTFACPFYIDCPAPECVNGWCVYW